MTPPTETYGRGDELEDRSIDLDAAERFTFVGKRRLCFVRVGPSSSSTVLFLPGLGATWKAWTSTIRRLASAFDCVAIDIPGFGGSERPADGMAVENVCRTIKGFVDDQIGRPVWVVAHSLGGLVATDLQRDRDYPIKGLALVSGVFPEFLVAFRRPTRLLRNLAQYGTATLAMVASALPFRAPLERSLRRSLAFRRLALRPFVERPNGIPPEMAANLAVGGSVVSVAGVLRNGFGYDYRSVLRSLKDPLMIHGSNDRLSRWADVQGVLDINSTARAVVVDGARHAAMVEYPSLVNDLLIEWLTGTR